MSYRLYVCARFWLWGGVGVVVDANVSVRLHSYLCVRAFDRATTDLFQQEYDGGLVDHGGGREQQPLDCLCPVTTLVKAVMMSKQWTHENPHILTPFPLIRNMACLSSPSPHPPHTYLVIRPRIGGGVSLPTAAPITTTTTTTTGRPSEEGAQHNSVPVLGGGDVQRAGGLVD